MRRLAAAALALAGVLAGCAPRAPQPAKVREIVFWTTLSPAPLAPLLSRFEAENPGLRVIVSPHPAPSLRDSIDAALAAGRAPDLCQFASADLPGYLAANALSDWSAGVADLRDSLYGWPTCMVGDAIYGLPWLLRANALLYDSALLARAGLDPRRPPATWAALEAASARVQRLGHGVHGFGIPTGGEGGRFALFMPFAWGDSADVLTDDGDSTRFDAPGSVAAMQLLAHLHRFALEAPPARLEAELAAGRLAFLVADGRVAARLADGPDARVRLAPIPAPSATYGHSATLANAEVLASFTSSKRKEDALRLARFLLRVDNQVALAAARPGTLPARRGADSTAWAAGRPAEVALARQLATARFAPVHRHWPEIESAIEFELGLAIGGRKSAAQAVADADSAIADLASRRKD